METLKTILLCVLGGGVGSGLMSILQAYLNRRWGKADKEDARIMALVGEKKLVNSGGLWRRKGKKSNV